MDEISNLCCFLSLVHMQMALKKQICTLESFKHQQLIKQWIWQVTVQKVP